MEKSAAVFVKWEEVFLTTDRGRREVRYYLKRPDGTSDLSVVGKEKDSRINNTTASYRYRYAIREKSLISALSNSSFEFPSKLRSRREVVDLLNSIVSDGPSPRPHQAVDGYLEAGGFPRLSLHDLEDVQSRTMGHATEFRWVGSSWACRKKRKHYEAYSRNGVRISVHSFVYILAEEDQRLVAYLDDMYEDSRGNKMVVVRWFHKVDEVGIDLPHSYNDREIFFSLCLQDLSIECIDGLATVLSPQHYKNFLKAAADTKLEPFVCQSQFDDEDIKPFDVTQVKGYWNQEVHRYISSTTLKVKVCRKLQASSDPTEARTNHSDAVEIRPKKRLRRLKDTDMSVTPFSERDAKGSSTLPVSCDRGVNTKDGPLAEGSGSGYAFVKQRQLAIGSHIEVLSQDSGIRGCWFRAVIIKKHKGSIKVRYQDIKDAADDSIDLEEWILSTRIAAPDQFGIRLCGRMAVRPTRLSNTVNVSLIDVGSIVDAWLHDGWWEGIVFHKESENRIHVYFPGEKRQSIFRCRDLRYSEEWLGDGWKQMKSRPDLLGTISSATETNLEVAESHDIKSDPAPIIQDKELGMEHKDSTVRKSVVATDVGVCCNPSKLDLLAHLNWNWSVKKRHCRKSSQKLQCDFSNNNNLELLHTRKHDSFFMSSLKVDHDNCKFISDSSLFHPPVGSPLTSLVMSR